MRYRTPLNALFIGFLTISFMASVTHAQYYSPYYSAPTYPYTYAPTSYYPMYNCPAGFISTVQNGLAVCYQYTPIGSYSNTYYPNYYTDGYTIPYSYPYSTAQGCIPGYPYSTLTGRRCDGNDDYYDTHNDAYLTNFQVRSGDDTNLHEGDTNAEILDVRFDVEGNDITLDRVTVSFQFSGTSTTEDRPWEVFDEVRLLSDGDEIDRIQTDDADEWTHAYGDTYSISFEYPDETIRENDRANITLEVDISSHIDSYRSAWTVFVPDRGIRARSDAGHTRYTGDSNKRIYIDIEQ